MPSYTPEQDAYISLVICAKAGPENYGVNAARLADLVDYRLTISEAGKLLETLKAEGLLETVQPDRHGKPQYQEPINPEDPLRIREVFLARSGRSWDTPLPPID